MTRRPETPNVAAKSEPKVPEKPAIDPNTDPRDVFIVAGSGFDFDDGGPAPAGEPEDQFTALLPESNDPNSFFAILPERKLEIPDKPVNLPPGFTAIASAGFTDDGLPRRIRCETDGAIMAFVPAGTSTMPTSARPTIRRES